MEKNKESLKNLTEELLSLLNIAAKIEVSEKEDSYTVNIDPEKESGLLIGAHGATLSAIQSFLSIAIKQLTGDWIKIMVDVANWGEKQNENLVGLAKQAAQRAMSTKEPQYLYNLNPAQRRIIHVALGEETDVITESVGEGDERYLIVKPK